LSGAAGAERQESIEGFEIADVRQAPHIALDVGLDIVRKPHIRGNLAVVYPGIKARAQCLPQFEARRPVAEESCSRIRFCLLLTLQFRPGKGHEIEDTAPAGQRLGHPAHQQEIM
jgi:hypothetical protein